MLLSGKNIFSKIIIPHLFVETAPLGRLKVRGGFVLVKRAQGFLSAPVLLHRLIAVGAIRQDYGRYDGTVIVLYL